MGYNFQVIFHFLAILSSPPLYFATTYFILPALFFATPSFLLTILLLAL